MNERHYSPLDHWLINADQALRTLFGKPLVTERPDPANSVEEGELNDAERDHSARLMRINHTGEVCAQALYQGQALTAKNEATRQSLQRAAQEENDHLEWCEQRIKQLDSRTSLLNPLFYMGSFALGAAAGLAGDKWSLGFVAETEHQVEKHLQEHQQQIPQSDKKTHAILQQMKEDEIRHADNAIKQGAAPLPTAIQKAMQASSKLMTGSVYYI
ncbi:MAG: 2-polyprenyl-3-methyl-6-methoxy-1,4-benzoquinone monooxygenase [gamma proteobacterium symbiont of Bathyaustriella thionipta]|nr:2-polyprenyl-3-methyl-6-methoxy-1,4-benzoquinone monooxygenase [gamma proteobacterium symbiont of Bathyaustriella thionipta]